MFIFFFSCRAPPVMAERRHEGVPPEALLTTACRHMLSIHGKHALPIEAG